MTALRTGLMEVLPSETELSAAPSQGWWAFFIQLNVLFRWDGGRVV
jgi:hypothetical protein